CYRRPPALCLMTKLTNLFLFVVFVGFSEFCNCQSSDYILSSRYNSDRMTADVQRLPFNAYIPDGVNWNSLTRLKIPLQSFDDFQNDEVIPKKNLPVLNSPNGVIKEYEESGTYLGKSKSEGQISSFKNSPPSDSLREGYSSIDKIANFPSKFLQNVNGKISFLQRQLNKQSKNYIKKLLKQEARLKRQAGSLDSNAIKNVFSTNAEKEYASLLRRLQSDSTVANPKNISGEYYPYIDSLQTTLSYLQQNQQLTANSKIAPEEVESTIRNLMVLQSKMQDADQIKQFIQQRKEQLKGYLSQFTKLSPGITKAYQNYNKQFYYYTEQVKSFRETLNDPDKRTKLAFTILNKVPAFSRFMQKNSLLASIFNLNGTYIPSGPGQGLPSRDQVMTLLQNRIIPNGGPNPSSFIQQKIQSAQGVVDKFRDKLTSMGNNSGADIDMPNFHPNNQKTKSFLKRLQLGTDLQTVHGSYYFPATTDFGLSLAYKIDSKNDVGLGVSAKIGWGQGFNHINLTGQGIGIRSFTDINIKKNFYATGGFEYNYQQPFNPGHLTQLKGWQESGLLGLSKKISLGNKFLKSMKTQLLWDFLSYEQTPRAQPLKFRIGYSF
ncbi:MAG TPA: hypothetical protein VFI29_14935, partial [Hanamia sp.]|nr:hypothetical protein [Hanamia sp.]